MGYDSRATLIKKEVKQLSKEDRVYLKLMKGAIKDAENSKSRRFSDPATALKSNKHSNQQDK